MPDGRDGSGIWTNRIPFGDRNDGCIYQLCKYNIRDVEQRQQ